jgi:hypothetical protein
MHAVIDPELLSLPDDFLAWVEASERWEELLADSPLSASCPAECQKEIYTLWSRHTHIAKALAEQECPLGVHDLLRVLEAIMGRLLSDPTPEDQQVLLDDLSCTPEYCPPDASAHRVKAMIEHLGGLAVQRARSQVDGGVITRESSWSHRSTNVAIEGIVVLQQMGEGPLEEPDPEDSPVRELLPLWRDPAEIMKVLASQPCKLMPYLKFGVRTYWVGAMNEDCRDLLLTFGPDFANSIQHMNYANHGGRAGTLLRVMAKIAAGQAADVVGHPERKGAGASNEIVTDKDGYQVERSYLAQKSPNAHRLFWVKRNIPHMLNVGGHKSKPIL